MIYTHKMENGPLSDRFFPFILAGQGISEAGLVPSGEGIQHVCLVLSRELNNHAVYKYLHSIIVFGQDLLG